VGAQKLAGHDSCARGTAQGSSQSAWRKRLVAELAVGRCATLAALLRSRAISSRARAVGRALPTFAPASAA
jgi:hypothetical protein